MCKRYITYLLILCLAGGLQAQTVEQAKKLFEKKEFEKAKPIFQNLVKKAPSNASYNFWYGACCYETGEKKKALPYLEKSAKRQVINAYRYLGKLYYDMYRFEEAVDNYEQHIEWLEKKNRPTDIAEAELQQVRQAARMIKGVENVTVVDSFAVDKEHFLDYYQRMGKESGKIYYNPSRAGTTYVTELENKQIFADKSGDGPMQLYTSNKLLDGWSDPDPIEPLNEQGNADFPFLMPDGVTLYYASDGEGSMGGYDIFVTRYDSEDGTYLRPDNIGMPFNSPANDYMFAIDELNGLGWFASDRFQPEGKVCIYLFVPNESKVVYDYEHTDQERLIALARLCPLSATWKDEEKLRIGRQRLATLMYAREEEQVKKDFTFIVDDSATYYTLDDFRSDHARAAYQELMQKEKDRNALLAKLTRKREAYTTSNNAQKKEMTPGILDLEKRTEQLAQEIRQLTLTVRNEEIKKLKR